MTTTVDFVKGARAAGFLIDQVLANARTNLVEVQTGNLPAADKSQSARILRAQISLLEPLASQVKSLVDSDVPAHVYEEYQS